MSVFKFSPQLHVLCLTLKRPRSFSDRITWLDSATIKKNFWITCMIKSWSYILLKRAFFNSGSICVYHASTVSAMYESLLYTTGSQGEKNGCWVRFPGQLGAFCVVCMFSLCLCGLSPTVQRHECYINWWFKIKAFNVKNVIILSAPISVKKNIKIKSWKKTFL